MADRRAFILSAILMTVAGVVEAKLLQKPYRIGFLGAGARPSDGLPPIALRSALEALGYREGNDYSFVGRWADARRDQLPALAAELVALNVDIIVTQGSSAAIAAHNATSKIPIVMTLSGDPVGVGLIASLAHPGGNVTGITDDATALSAKRLQLLKQMLPTASTIAILWNAGDLAMNLRVQEIDRAANVLGVSLRKYGVREPDDFEMAFKAMDRQRPDALFMVTDAFTNLNRRLVLDFVEKRRIPAMYEYGSLVRDGGLIAYGPSLEDMFQRAAIFIDKMLKGVEVSDLPVEEPTKFYLLINLRTAKALGLTIPQSLLLRADEVIQ
jgi:putative ABC transport system substrate-binding protein